MPYAGDELRSVLQALLEVGLEFKKIDLVYRFPFETLNEETNVEIQPRDTERIYVGFDSVGQLPKEMDTKDIKYELHGAHLDVESYGIITVDLSDKVIIYFPDPKLKQKLKAVSRLVGYELEEM